MKISGPVVPSPTWNRAPPRSSIKRRDPLSRKAIVDAAIRILDVDGLDGFTMRRVAEALGTGPTSLYWHVGSKDGLLDLVFEEVIGEQDIPTLIPGAGRNSSKTSRA
jgi:AcrR family transcriptional regulator